MTDDATEPTPAEDRRLWQLQPVRDAFWIGIGGLCLYLAYVVRNVTGPLLIALALAWLVNPTVEWLHGKLGVSRTVIAAVWLVLVAVAWVVTLSLVLPAAAQQVEGLAEELPGALERLSAALGIDETLADQLDAGVGWREMIEEWAGTAADLVRAITRLLGRGSSLLISAVFTLALFVYFVVAYESLPDASVYIPADIRDETLALLERFEQAFFGFLRGQVVVALFTTTAFGIGFSLIGVPYALVAAAIGGLLSFIPYGQASGPLLAVLFGVMSSVAGGGDIDWVSVAVLPGVVYLVSQSMETFVITPLVQGSMTKLHPLMVFGALLAGGSLGGLLGVFFAIPVAACARILLVEVVLPVFRRMAAGADEPTP